MYEQPNTQDSNFSRMARISFSVKIMERQDLFEGLLINDNETTVKLDLTEQGFQYKLNV